MKTTKLYGSFDLNAKIASNLNFVTDSESEYPFILTENFTNAKLGDVHLFFSGIIYNLDDLKAGFSDKNLSEVNLLVHIFLKNGIQAFSKVNGKFLILIYRQGEFIAVRDRYGEGPMLYYTDDYFCDHFEHVFDFKDFVAKPNRTAIASYLMYSYVPSPLSSLNGLNKLEGGGILIKNQSGVKLETLFSYQDFVSDRTTMDETEALEEYERLFKLSILRRIKGHDTVGALLSGGYDSGGNISVLPEVFTGKIKSYSIGFKDNPFSELPYARMMAEQFGAEHNEYLMDGSELEGLPFLVKNMGDPFSESGWMLNNSAMQLVHDKDLPVVLGGDGSDQLFTAALKELAYKHLFKKRLLAPAQNLFSAISKNSFFEKDNIFFRARFHNDKILGIMRPDQFGFQAYQVKKLMGVKSFKEHPVLSQIPNKFSSFDEMFNVRNFHVDIKQNSSEVIINKASRISQMYGVNLAFTYIDLDVFNFVKNLPRNLKVKGSIEEIAKGKGISKYLLKALIKPKLPEAVTSRKKQGGFSPLEMFFSDPAKRQKIYKYILDSDIASGFFDHDFLSEFFKAYEASVAGNYWFWFKQTMANRMINLLVMTLWWDIFLVKKEGDKLSDFIG
jgi:asparagine synthase (glutamine-hydrolysing)